MFRGSATVNLDEKGRFAIPSRFRDRVQDVCQGKVVVTLALNERCVGMPDCLWIYPLCEWEEVEKKIKELPTFKKKAVKLKRFLIGSAFECEMDAQGRILLPEKLRKYAGLEKKLELVGQLTRLELWNEHAWEEQFKDDDEDEDMDEINSLSF